jgi:hypothetical protein
MLAADIAVLQTTNGQPIALRDSVPDEPGLPWFI